jgi:predicted O-methyltransferase YrrM
LVAESSQYGEIDYKDKDVVMNWAECERSADIPPALQGKPWSRSEAPAAVLERKGMVGPAERACYFWLARNWITGTGAIVDAGAFVGASTASFAAGAAASRASAKATTPYIHAYDFFEVNDEYVRSAISRDFGPIGMGESYLHLFRSQIAPYGNAVREYPGDFRHHSWNAGPIEILFIDIAKTPELNRHLIKEFFRA